MKKYFISLIIAFVGLCSFTGLNDDCLEQVKKLYARQSSMQLQDDKILYLNYSVSSTNRSKKSSETFQSKVEIYATTERFCMESDRMIVYNDSKNYVCILPQKKTIILRNAKSNGKQQKKLVDYGLALQDSLFKHTKVEYCNTEKTYKKVKLKMDTEGEKKFNIKYLEIVINEAEEKIEKVNMTYNDKSKVQQLNYTFGEIKQDYKTDKLNKSALENIFKRGKTLHNQYSGYKVLDKRETKS